MLVHNAEPDTDGIDFCIFVFLKRTNIMTIGEF